MALELSDYISLVKGYLDESRTIASQRYSDAEITLRLNEAQRMVAREVDLFFFRGTDTTDVTNTTVTPPVDFLSNATISLVVSATERRPIKCVSAKQMYKDNPNWPVLTAQQYPTSFVYGLDETGFSGVFSPPPTATITDGALWEYKRIPTDMVDTGDEETSVLESEVMALFPELQPTTLPARACSIMLLLDAGTQDLQFAKWDAIFWRDIETMRQYCNDLVNSSGDYMR